MRRYPAAAQTESDAALALSLPTGNSHGWVVGYRHRVMLTDVVIISAVVMISQNLRFGGTTAGLLTAQQTVGYWMISLLLAVGWVVALALHGAWDAKSLGAGPTEFRRVTVATCAVISCTAIISFLGRMMLARGYLAIAFPLGLLGLLAGRGVWRLLLAEHRRAGTHLSSVLVVGGRASAAALAQRLRSRPEAGYRVAGLCVPGAVPAIEKPAEVLHDFPVVGGTGDVLRAIQASGADTVAVAASDTFGPEDIRRLAWELEGTSIQLILAPALTDVAGPRIHIEPVAGLPLMDVRAPQFDGPQLLAKGVLDYLVAGLGLIVLSPVLLCTALAVATSGWPVFDRPIRIGRAGRPFRLFRFRTGTAAADRSTRVGRLIRSAGVDRSAALFNVLLGHMSIVGTRAIRPTEIYRPGIHLERRTRLRPGITGPVQVLGRCDLSDADQIQLELRYLENWSIPRDLLIMARALGSRLHRRQIQSPASPGR